MDNKKVVVISGATSGIGLEILKEFDNMDCIIIGIGRRSERLQLLSDKIDSEFYQISADVSNREELFLNLDKLPEKIKTPDYIINAAGLSLGFDEFAEAKYEDWNVMIDTNIKGVLNLTSYYLSRIKERNKGHIINVGSIAAVYPYLGANVYAGTKAFIHNFTMNLKSEFSGTNVKITNISPGMVKSEFALVRFKGDNDKAENFYKNYKPLTPNDIAKSVMFCVSQPDNVNITNMEIMSIDQPFHLGLSKKGKDD